MPNHSASPPLSYPRRLPARRRRNGIGCGVLILGAILLVAGLAVGGFMVSKNVMKGTRRTVVTQVTDKARVCSMSSSGGSCQYLIYTAAGTFKLTDTLLFGRFNTSDVYGRIQRGVTYRLTVVGWRIGFFSEYPNILQATPVTSGGQP